jgi:hypothetical protein
MLCIPLRQYRGGIARLNREAKALADILGEGEDQLLPLFGQWYAAYVDQVGLDNASEIGRRWPRFRHWYDTVYQRWLSLDDEARQRVMSRITGGSYGDMRITTAIEPASRTGSTDAAAARQTPE